MTNDPHKSSFLSLAEQWIGDGSFVTIKYLAIKIDGKTMLSNASMVASRQLCPDDFEFHIDIDGLIAGCILKKTMSKEELIEIVGRASNGIIEINDDTLSAGTLDILKYHSESHITDRALRDLHLAVFGESLPYYPNINYAMMDSQLRRAEVPFDGLAELTSCIGLRITQTDQSAASIIIRVLPPVDLVLEQCRLNANKATICVRAPKGFQTSSVGLAVRAIPGNGKNGRQQIAPRVVWKPLGEDQIEGTVEEYIENADRIQVILMAGQATVRRHWLSDPLKSRNSKLMAMLNFDENLKQIRSSLIRQGDDKKADEKFEKSVAVLFFLLGFSPAMPLVTDAPDIVMTTPRGKTVLVECTIKIRDFSVKLAKLVERCNVLSKAFESSGHSSRVHGILVCGQPRQQIITDDDQLTGYKIHLMTEEDIVAKLDKIEEPFDPDEMLEHIDRQFIHQDFI